MKILLKQILIIILVVGFLLRVVFMFFPPEGASLGVFDAAKAIGIGVINDAAMGIFLCLPLLLVYVGLNEWKYRRIAGYSILALLVVAFLYVTFTHSIFHEYGGVVPKIATALIGYKLLSFSLRFFFPSIRIGWRKVTLCVLAAFYVFLLLGNGIAEWLFWDEFGVRYNFIAVDYLIYTNEVVGNIMESYAIVPLLLLVGLLTAAVIWYTVRRHKFQFENLYTPRQLLVHVGIAGAMAAVSYFYLGCISHSLEGDNLCANQIQQNGCYDFLEAFRDNKLDYAQFYTMIPQQACRDAYRRLCAFDTRTHTDTVADRWKPLFNIPATPVNIVLLTVESLSADFLTAYGNTGHLTPSLDSLIPHSMVFDRFYAVGNRTVRGLEALSLGIPPSAGESIVKRPDNRRDGQTIAHILARHGYKSQFIYGGDSYFDNMGNYFSNNGYEVIDRKQISQVTFSNIWGVCDEDLFDKALQVFDANARGHQPFFAQLMTVSNHRPYTYPDGRIQWQGNPQCRDAAVKYTDYAIGQFLKKAQSHTWFDNTIFIVTADHCASSAGKTSIPVDKYHIPCIIYAPRMIQPCRVETLCSQIDIIPTLLAMLHFSDATPFTGRNVLAAGYRSRAFMATYQDLGYLENDILTVLSPRKAPSQYAVRQRAPFHHTEEKLPQHIDSLIFKTRSYYQYTNQ